jgi:hypothetical protein
VAAAILGCALHVCSAADPAPPALSASDLAARLSAFHDTSYVRLRLEVKQPAGAVKVALQLQIKERRTKTTADVVYQVLWPKERKGESVLLRKAANRAATGALFTPPDTVRPLDASQMNEPLFGSDLSYEDVIENFFAWEHQALVGTEVVDRVNCQILESKPGKGDRSTYASVRAWVDVRRLVPLRVEKYLASGQLARRIDTTNVSKEDDGRYIPANLTVRGPRKDSVTELEGSRIKHDLIYADREFTPDGLKELTPPRNAPE